jgi:phage terminase large subunit-like protein
MAKNQSNKDRRSYDEFLKHLAFVKDYTSKGLNAAESIEDKKQRAAELRQNYGSWFEYYFPHYCTDEEGRFSKCAKFHIEFATSVKKDRTIQIAQRWGRGLAKSVHSTMGIPIYLWACGEQVFEVVIGNNENSAHRLLDDVRAELEMNQRLINDYGEQVVHGDWEKGEFSSKDGRLLCKGLGMGQNPRGLRKGARRPNYVVADDLEDAKTVKNPQRQHELAEWIQRGVLKMMVGNTRRFISANNHFSPQTIQSLLAKKMKTLKIHRVDACNKVTFEPSWPERDTKEKYQEMAREGMLSFLSEFCNEPHVEGSIFRNSDIIYMPSSVIPTMSKFEHVAGYWDVAYGGTSTSDFNSIIIAGALNGKYYPIATFCKQSKMEEALLWLADFKKKQKASRPIHLYYESQFWNDSVKQAIEAVERKEKISFQFLKHQTEKSAKYDRILMLQPYFQRSEIIFNESFLADPDMQVGLSQLYGIEPGYKTHDDWPDAFSALVKLLHYHTKSAHWEAPRHSNKTRNPWY